MGVKGQCLLIELYSFIKLLLLHQNMADLGKYMRLGVYLGGLRVPFNSLVWVVALLKEVPVNIQTVGVQRVDL